MKTNFRLDMKTVHKPHLLTCKMPEQQQQQQQPQEMRMNVGCWVSDRHLLRRRRCRDFFITFRQPEVIDKTQHLGQKVIANNPDARENAESPHNRHLTSPSTSLPLYTSSVSPQRTKNKVSFSAQTNDLRRRSLQTSVGQGVLKGGAEHAPQLTRGKTSAGDALECSRLVGLPGKEWVRLVRANPQDPVLRRLDITNNRFACTSSNGRVENRSIGSHPESNSHCNSLTGKKFPTLYPLPSQVIRTKPFNAAIGARSRSSVSSLFQQSCERIFTSNRCRYQWIATGNERLLQELFQKRKEEDDEEELTRLVADRFVPEDYEYFTSKTPNNSPAPENVINEVRQNKGFENEDQKKAKEKDADDMYHLTSTHDHLG